ncbi:MAG: hypothetical protein FWB74_03310 [Defluviitaleaceae bacterium]|nr:hypothetical protein [Defluviitaleaceae bacterium]
MFDREKKQWSGDIAAKYPEKWIVMVEVEYDYDTNKHMGYVHFVTDNEKEAYDECQRIGDTMGVAFVEEGIIPYQWQVGGLTSC